MNLYLVALTVFITQLIFIGARTWNIKAIADKQTSMVILSGAVIHIVWLISITIGVTSMVELMRDFKPVYILIIIASVSGGSLGTYLAMRDKEK